MFDIQTEAHLRCAHPRDGDGAAPPIMPLAFGVSLLLWAAVLRAAL